jgi:hypothetical protein
MSHNDGPNFDCCNSFNECRRELKCIVHRNKWLKKGGTDPKKYRQKCNFYRNTIKPIKAFKDEVTILTEKGYLVDMIPTKKVNKAVKRILTNLGTKDALLLLIGMSRGGSWAVADACKALQKEFDKC